MMEVGRSCPSRSSNQFQARLCKMHQNTSHFVWCRFEKKEIRYAEYIYIYMTRIKNFVSNERRKECCKGIGTGQTETIQAIERAL
jgi:hypothetical protein